MGVGKLHPYTGRPWIFEVAAGDSKLEMRKEEAEMDGGLVEISSHRMRTVEQLWTSYGEAFAFPWQVENWPSFSEQMRDLSWYQAFSFLVVISESEELLADDPGESETFKRISSRIGQAWENSPVKPFLFSTILVKSEHIKRTDLDLSSGV
ncbi:MULTISPECIES: barstar family protein [unclassified Rathayibacter]|uniref:barstar family protein n=1 Tax=unclassified Rathayibacter TaxID=2609250 RepID=UPI00188BDD62|nr:MULTISPECIES: barstar family protein [unclassified Rathayibacter]MBF4462278.1 barstar family protein [Rathayibacter sp. VKM Ac-2879]MBF4503679.1 barstar family protein [Rathayibacter sp. VKM Ac-2878]